MNNNLTRKVLIEKKSVFGRYNHPKDVPDRIWYIYFCEISKLSHTDIVEYIASKIISPLLNKVEYNIIKNVIYDPNTFTPFKLIVFDNKWIFRVSADMFQDLTSMYGNGEMLKEFISLVWESNKSFNRNINQNNFL